MGTEYCACHNKDTGRSLQLHQTLRLPRKVRSQHSKVQIRVKQKSTWRSPRNKCYRPWVFQISHRGIAMRALMLRSSVGRITLESQLCLYSWLSRPGLAFWFWNPCDSCDRLHLEAYTNDGKANNPRGANEFPELHWFYPWENLK